MMFSKFQLENFLRTFTKNPKSTKYICMDELKSNKNKIPAKKLHKSARVMDDYDQAKLIIKDVKQPLLSSSSSQLGKVAHNKGGKKGDVKNNSCGSSRSSSSSNNNNSSVRVKVLMTKAEAAMLLAKRKKEGNLEFGDVVKELAKIPAQRVSVVSVMASPKRPMALPSIFEEDL